MTNATSTETTFTTEDIKSRIVEFMEGDWDEEAFLATLSYEERNAYFECEDVLTFKVKVEFDD